MPRTPDLPPLEWDGFPEPNWTPVPDALFDVLLPYLSDAELRVLLYLVRRTYGFKKRSDAVSLSQITGGIVKADGTRLDGGAGLSRQGAINGVKGLVSKGIIVAQHNRSATRGDEPTTYRVRVSRESTPLTPLVNAVDRASQAEAGTGVNAMDPQETKTTDSKDKRGEEPPEFSPLDEAVMRQLRLSPDEYRSVKAQKL